MVGFGNDRVRSVPLELIDSAEHPLTESQPLAAPAVGEARRKQTWLKEAQTLGLTLDPEGEQLSLITVGAVNVRSFFERAFNARPRAAFSVSHQLQQGVAMFCSARLITSTLVLSLLSTGCATSSALVRRDALRERAARAEACRNGSGDCGGYGQLAWGTSLAEVIEKTGCQPESTACARKATTGGLSSIETYLFVNNRLSDVLVTFETKHSVSYESVVQTLSSSLGKPTLVRDPAKGLQDESEREDVLRALSLFTPRFSPAPSIYLPSPAQQIELSQRATESRCSLWLSDVSRTVVCAREVDGVTRTNISFSSDAFASIPANPFDTQVGLKLVAPIQGT